jgi:hypothetical protein
MVPNGATPTFQEKLQYLVESTGRPEAEIVALAVDEGLLELCRRRLTDAYQAGDTTREEAAVFLSAETLDQLDVARRAVEDDVRWALADA